MHRSFFASSVIDGFLDCATIYGVAAVPRVDVLEIGIEGVLGDDEVLAFAWQDVIDIFGTGALEAVDGTGLRLERGRLGVVVVEADDGDDGVGGRTDLNGEEAMTVVATPYAGFHRTAIGSA